MGWKRSLDGSVRNRHAEIAGAGIAGLAAATALAQRGWTVRVHERSKSIRVEGAGIYIWENGLRVLQALGAYDYAIEGCHRGFVRETRDAQNRMVSKARYNGADGPRVVSIVRERLLQALADAATRHGVEICFDSVAVGAGRDGELRFACGRTQKADLVIGADGVNSAVRDSLGLLKWRRPLGDGAMRFLIPFRDGEYTAPAGGHYIEYWSGKRRLLYTPCSSTGLYLALTAMTSDRAGSATPIDKDVWKASFPHLASFIDRIVDVGHFAEFVEIQLKCWSAGQVAIVGDAAHAQAPNLGQGGGCALMSALSLAVRLESQPDVDVALKQWEHEERPLIQRTQRISTLYGKIGAMPDWVRSGAFWAISKSRWATSQRFKAATHKPLGTSELPAL